MTQQHHQGLLLSGEQDKQYQINLIIHAQSTTESKFSRDADRLGQYAATCVNKYENTKAED